LILVLAGFAGWYCFVLKPRRGETSENLLREIKAEFRAEMAELILLSQKSLMTACESLVVNNSSTKKDKDTEDLVRKLQYMEITIEQAMSRLRFLEGREKDFTYFTKNVYPDLVAKRRGLGLRETMADPMNGQSSGENTR